MKNHPLSIPLLLLGLEAGQAPACSVFCLLKGEQPVVGRNYDWSFNEGMIFLNPRGLAKTAFSYYGEPADNPAQWVAKFGSATICQYGRENGFVGMNEAGLVVHQLELGEAQYPAADSRKSVSMDQWIQYQLDNFATVAEVLNSDKFLRIRRPSGNYSRVHFFVTERSGKSAVLEHINGVLVSRSGASLPVAALTNDTYQNSLEYWKRGVTDSGSTASLDRFFRAAALSQAYDTALALGPYAAGMLARTEQGTTRYSILFDPVGGYILYQSDAHRQYRYFTLKSFDLSCRAPARMLDVEAVTTGDATAAFVEYRTAANRALIQHAWTGLGIAVNPAALDFFSGYPDRCACQDPLAVRMRSGAVPGARARFHDAAGRLAAPAVNWPTLLLQHHAKNGF